MMMLPRVAAKFVKLTSPQPWAKGSNPFGISKPSINPMPNSLPTKFPEEPCFEGTVMMTLIHQKQVAKTAQRVSDRNAFTLVELLVVIAIIGILVALLLPAIQAAREAARRSQCQSNMKNVALAVLNYEDRAKKFPVGMSYNAALYHGKAHNQLAELGPNWIIRILPYLEQQAIYDRFDLKWPINGKNKDAPPTDPKDVRNHEARGASIGVLLCPSDGYNQVLYAGKITFHGNNWARGNYAGNAGNNYIGGGGCMRYNGDNDGYSACTDGPNASGSLPDLDGWWSDYRRGVMGLNISVRIAEITDGTTKTIMVGEVRAGISDKDARGVWAMGHAGSSLIARYGSAGDDNGPNVCFPAADDVYSDICGEPVSREECMACHTGGAADQATVRSSHVGGAMLAMCDGSVNFVSDDVETSGVDGEWGSPWDYMISSADAEAPARP
jgi:prepilin-type N-terminal cleavage/methylation domain-containing protein